MFGHTRRDGRPQYVVVTLEKGRGFDRQEDARAYLESLDDEFRGIFKTYNQVTNTPQTPPRLSVSGFCVYGNTLEEKGWMLKEFAKAVANGEEKTWFKENKKYIK